MKRLFLVLTVLAFASSVSAATVHGVVYRGAKATAKAAVKPHKAVKAAAKGVVKAVKHL